MTVLAERYELGDVLGEGGMGRVVIAHDRVLQRDVAVKLLTGASDADSRARFLREARDSARLRHPNAVTVYDTGEHDGQPFIVMELVRGITLAELVAEEGPLAVEVAVAITVGVLEALDAAHAAGIVHRDVKPGNVILPDEGGVKLSDFGIAKAMDDATSALTAAGTVLGTPAYLAPELLDGGVASPASDLYAVGCMLYLQLTGEPPFSAETPLAVAYAHVNREVPPVELQRPDVPDGLRRVLDTALAKDPARRYVDAAAMRASLLGDDVPTAPRDATLPLTTAFPAAAAPPPAATPAAATPAAKPGATGQGPQDATVALAEGSTRQDTSSPPAWRAFAVGAVLLLAVVLIAVAWPFGGTDTDDEPTEQDEPDEPGESPDDPTSDDPAPDGPTPDDPAPDAPTPDDPAPDAPTPDEPDPGDPAPEPPAPDEPDGPDEPAPVDPPDTDPPGDGPGPDGDGPPGQDGAPGQED